MSKKITFAVTIKDDHDLVLRLGKKLVSNDYDIRFVGLGSQEELDSLYATYNDMVGIDRLPVSISLGHILVFSIDAFFELESLLLISDSLRVWSDPEFLSNDLESYLVEVLAGNCSSAIIARTLSGKNAWEQVYGVVAPILPSIFSDSVPLDGQPLIEKAKKARFLLDGGSEVINNHLIEPFLQFGKYDVDVWCVYDGVLKPWMVPGMYFTGIPREERGLYYRAVDGVVVADLNITGQKIIDYISAGIMPIASSVDVKNKMSVFFNDNVQICVITEPEFGKILESRESIAAYNATAEFALKQEADFSLTVLEDTVVPARTVVKSMGQLASKLAQKDFFRIRYNDEKGTAFHQNFKAAKAQSVIATIEADHGTYAVITGWGVDIDTWEPTYPKVNHGSKTVSMFLEKMSRQDVSQAFSVAGKTDEVGFVGHLAMTGRDIGLGDLEVVNFSVDNHYSNFSSLDESFKNVEMPKEYPNKDSIKGYLDSYTPNNALIFDLSGLEVDGEIGVFKLRVLKNSLVCDLEGFSSLLLCSDTGVNKSVTVDGDSFILDRFNLGNTEASETRLLIITGISVVSDISNYSLEVIVD
jgi:hypothetical protein